MLEDVVDDKVVAGDVRLDARALRRGVLGSVEVTALDLIVGCLDEPDVVAIAIQRPDVACPVIESIVERYTTVSAAVRVVYREVLDTGTLELLPLW